MSGFSPAFDKLQKSLKAAEQEYEEVAAVYHRKWIQRVQVAYTVFEREVKEEREKRDVRRAIGVDQATSEGP